MLEVYISWIYSFLVLCNFYPFHQNLQMNIKYSSNIQPCFLSDSSNILSNWAYCPNVVILKTFNWKSEGERLGTIQVIYYIRSRKNSKACKTGLFLQHGAKAQNSVVSSPGCSTVHNAWCTKIPTTSTEWIHNGCPQQYWEKTVQGPEESEKPATYVNKHGDEVH